MTRDAANQIGDDTLKTQGYAVLPDTLVQERTTSGEPAMERQT